MELVLVCRQCGHTERGESARGLMVKVRMLNHLNRAHPDEVESFTHSVEQTQPSSH